jgi:hypothetical protein
MIELNNLVSLNNVTDDDLELVTGGKSIFVQGTIFSPPPIIIGNPLGNPFPPIGPADIKTIIGPGTISSFDSIGI